MAVEPARDRGLDGDALDGEPLETGLEGPALVGDRDRSISRESKVADTTFFGARILDT